MANVVNLENVPCEFLGKKMLADLEAIPDTELVTEIGRNVSKLTTLTPEETSKLMPVVFRNQFFMADELCSTGRAVGEVARALGKVDRKAGLAVLAGACALGVGYYLYTRIQRQETRIRILENEVTAMKSGNTSAIGF